MRVGSQRSERTVLLASAIALLPLQAERQAASQKVQRNVQLSGKRRLQRTNRCEGMELNFKSALLLSSPSFLTPLTTNANPKPIAAAPYPPSGLLERT